MHSPSRLYLHKRSNGYYYAGYPDEGRVRWKSTRCRTKSEALKAVVDLQALLKPRPSRTTLSTFSSSFLSYAEATYARRTLIIYRQSFGHLQRMARDLLLTSLTPKHLDDYKTERLRTVAPVTVNIELRALKAALNTAVRWKLLDKSPFEGVQYVRTVEVAPVFFSRRDFERLVSVIGDRWLKELVLFAVSTGMRQGEILHLRWKNVDLARRLIHIESGATFKTKQGRRRTVPMSELVHALLSRKAPVSRSEYVFARKGKPIGESYLTHRFKKWLRVAGLNEALHWHSLRHTHASWLVQRGASLYEVQKLLGHSSSRVTEKYSHLQPEQLHGTVNRLELGLN